MPFGETGTRDDGEGPDEASGLQKVAERHEVSLEAVRHVLRALERGYGRMAQFDHPDLGGMGQWSAGGMTMVGRMFDDGLRARVAALCTELAARLPAEGFSAPGHSGGVEPWWPGDLGRPSSTGSQNGMRYAYFPESRRLAIEEGSGVSVYDTGDHAISGVSQANGLLTFTGSAGAVALDRLRRVEGGATPSPEPARAAPADPAHGAPPQAAPVKAFVPPPVAPPKPSHAPSHGADDVLTTIERLADLHKRGVLTDQEFQAKKAELLARL
nr:SHOCT domain-containing protein [Methylobacterium aerolatum]